MRNALPLSLCLLALRAAPGAQQPPHPAAEGQPEPPRSGAVRWYAGDTHEHFQPCLAPAQPLEEILARMEAEDLSVGNVLVWNPGAHSAFADFACLVTGELDPLSTPTRALSLAVETSGLDCAKWGHLIGLGVGPEEARIVTSSLAGGDCCNAPGIVPGCGGDGTGHLAAPVAQHFLQRSGAVTGYAHVIWPLDDYFGSGFPWYSELVASQFTRDARCIDPDRLLAVPNLTRFLVEGSLIYRTFFPLLGAVDAVLGEVDFVETIALGPRFPLRFQPLAHWQGLAYRLASLGSRVAFAAGSDQDCAFLTQDVLPRTYVWLDEPFSHAAWTRGLAAGRTSLGIPGLRIDLLADGMRAGESLYLDVPAEVRIRVVVESAEPRADGIELLAGGQVVATQPVTLAAGRNQVEFGPLALPESTWLAARLASQLAHTGPLHVYVDRLPIADCQAAEYWMLWCDIVAKTALQVPQLDLFGCQRSEAFARLARARRAFKTYRDVEGFDAELAAERYGRSTPGARGPISIGTTARARSEQPLLLTCVNAPAQAQGVLHLSRAQRLPGACQGDFRLLVGTEPDELVASLPVQATRSGYAEVLVPALPDVDRLFAQFVWTNPPGQPGHACGSAQALRSASDGLALEVERPELLAIAVTPVAPSIAKGTSLALTAMGFFSDGRKRELTAALAWSSSDPGVASVANAPGPAGRVTGHALGTATIVASDPATGVSGSTELTVTPAVLTALEVAPAKASLALGFAQPFEAVGTFSDQTTQVLTELVAWSSTDPEVAHVDGAGLVTTLGLGTTTIVATAPGSSLTGTATLTVTPAVLVTLEIAPVNPSIALGTGLAFTATGVFSDGLALELTETVLWSSSDPLVASITSGPGQAGLAASHTVGHTTIRAEDPLSGVVGTSALEVTPAVLVSLQVSPATAAVPLGLAQAFRATGIYTDASTQDLTAQVTWSSADPGVAQVSNAPGSEGLATGLALGTTLVSAVDPETKRAGSAELAVTPAVLSAVRVLPATTSLALGFELAYAAEGTYSDGGTRDLTQVVTWSSSAPDVAVVSNAPGSQGLATSLAVGFATVRATEPKSGRAGEGQLTVTPAVLTALEVQPLDPSVALGLALPFAAVGTYSDASTRTLTTSVTWSSVDPAVAVVSNAPGSQGLATTLAVGSAQIVARDPKSAIFGSSQLTVTPAVLVALALAPQDAVVGLGTSTPFQATGTYSDGTLQDLTGAVTWSSSDPSVAAIDNAPGSAGVAQALGVGSTTIAAYSSKTGLSAATSLTVRPVLETLVVLPAEASVLEGATRAFVAIGTYNDGSSADLTGQVQWSSSNPAVALVLAEPGRVRGLVPGTVTITASDPLDGALGTASLRVIERR
ncbi:MAG TPA: Ig-like domain-containing protein [Planctomycetota bacterium]